MTTESQTGTEPRLKLLHDALESGTVLRATRLLQSLHPSEIADLLESLPPAQREFVWELVEDDVEGDVLLEVHDEVRGKLVEGMDAREVIAAAEGMDIDDLADFAADLPEALLRQVLQSMDHEHRAFHFSRVGLLFVRFARVVGFVVIQHGLEG